MKKINLLSVLLVLVIGGILFSSCSKDDTTKSLNGTVWETQVVSDEISYLERFEFYDKECFLIIEQEISDDDFSMRKKVLNYTYNHPEVIIMMKNENYYSESTITINRNQMEMYHKRTDSKRIFYKIK